MHLTPRPRREEKLIPKNGAVQHLEQYFFVRGRRHHWDIYTFLICPEADSHDLAACSDGCKLVNTYSHSIYIMAGASVQNTAFLGFQNWIRDKIVVQT